MNTTQMLATAAFAAMTALTPFAGHAKSAAPAGAAPTRAFPNIKVNVAENSYVTNVGRLEYGSGTMELVNCTTGTVSQYSGSSGHVGGGMRIVNEYPSKVQDAIRANCNSNGLRAGF